MIKKHKRWSEMTTQELAAATKRFDDPNYHPRARKASRGELAQLHRVQRRSAANRCRIALVLDKDLIEAVDSYAAHHGVAFSEVVSDALTRLIGSK